MTKPKRKPHVEKAWAVILRAPPESYIHGPIHDNRMMARRYNHEHLMGVGRVIRVEIKEIIQ